MRQACQFIARFVTGAWRQVARDEKGNILPIAAIGMLVAVIVVGSAVDLSRNYMVRQQLQSACDAAVLAGRRTVTTAGFDAASQAAATTYFNTNYSDAVQGTRSTVFNATTPDAGQTISGTASTILDTLLMRIFGYTNFPITVTCASSMGVGNSDVMMVLDNTGSMGYTLSGSQTRIQALSAAMKNFYTTVYNATAASNARIRYGFVPFSSSVNVGRLVTALNSDYIVDSYPYQSRVYEPDDSGNNDSTGNWNLYSYTSYSSQSSCNSASPSNTTPSDYTSGGTKYQRNVEYSCIRSDRYSPYYIYWRYDYRPYVLRYRQITYDTSKFKKFGTVNTPTGSTGGNVSSSWDGCIQERGTVAQSTFTYTPGVGITPTAAQDLDLDSAPVLTDPTSKWAPLWPDVSYQRRNSYGGLTSADISYYGAVGGDYCPVAAQQLQTMSQSDFNIYADSMQAVGGTYLDIGMIWGGRLMSPTGMWSSLVNNDPSNGGKVARHIIFMTDGQMEPANYVPQAWGMELWDKRVTDDGSTNDAARHTQRFLATCAAIKDKGIRIWVIAFTSTLSSDLTTCASDSSSFTASSSSDLNAAFQEIAKQVGELRVVQ